MGQAIHSCALDHLPATATVSFTQPTPKTYASAAVQQRLLVRLAAREMLNLTCAHHFRVPNNRRPVGRTDPP